MKINPQYKDICEDVAANITFYDKLESRPWVKRFRRMLDDDKTDVVSYIVVSQYLYIREQMELGINPIPLPKIGKFYYTDSSKLKVELMNRGDLSIEQVNQMVIDEYKERVIINKQPKVTKTPKRSKKRQAISFVLNI
jgi:hypothetical protein